MTKTTIFILLMALLLSLTGCSQGLVDPTNSKEFNFILEYGILGNESSTNRIDTNKNTLLKDTIEGPVEIDFRLTTEDMDIIHHKIQELDLLEPSKNVSRNPEITRMDLGHGHNGYWRLTIYNHGEEKTYYWTTKSFPRITTEEIMESVNRKQSLQEYMLELHDHDEQLVKLYNLSEVVSYILGIIDEYDEIKEFPPLKMYL